MVDEIRMLILGNGSTPRLERTVLNGSSQWMIGGKLVEFSLQANIRCIDPDPAVLGWPDLHSRACTCVTGTASAGRPYTTACSPNRMILPGADGGCSREIEHSQHDQRPEQQADLKRTVGEQDFLRRTAGVLDLHEIEVSEDGVHHEWDASASCCGWPGRWEPRTYRTNMPRWSCPRRS